MLEKLLHKLGVNSFAELNEEERRTYHQWNQMLQGRKLTDKDVSAFFAAELDDAISKLKPDLPERVDIFLKMKIEFIRSVQTFLATPEREREALKQQLENLW